LHLLLSILILLASARWGDWKNWKQYYPTMLFISIANLMYKLFAHTYFHLWELVPDFIIFNKLSVFFLHGLIINPFSAFLFLSKYPKDKFRQFYHTLLWVIIYLSVEWVAVEIGSIVHDNGWNMGWSAVFVLTMFPMLRLHFLHPFIALILSSILTVFYLFVFDYL
jgi:hypothetical protein